MLIVAIPKSASTSLASTFGSIHGMCTKQVSLKDLEIPEKTPYLGKVHSDCRELRQDQVALFASKDELYKQHIPPTPNNLRLLQNVPKVVLLRDPDAIVPAYHRARRRLMKHNLPGLSMLLSVKRWKKKAKELGLYDDLVYFYQGWIANSGTNCLIVMYEDLIAKPAETIRKMEAFWDLPLSDDSDDLHKKRYSRSVLPALSWAVRQRVTGLLNLVRTDRSQKEPE